MNDLEFQEKILELEVITASDGLTNLFMEVHQKLLEQACVDALTDAVSRAQILERVEILKNLLDEKMNALKFELIGLIEKAS
jgi:hypothetical protein